MQNLKDFLKTEAGKKLEAALWQMAVALIGVVIVYAGEMNMAWLLPWVGVMNAASKYINVTYIK